MMHYTYFMERNPVGSWARDSEIPAYWRDMREILRFGGESAAMFEWVNGKSADTGSFHDPH